jgi:hypothetical protein
MRDHRCVASWIVIVLGWVLACGWPADAPASGVTSSDIVITPDGRHLYAGIRGHDHAYDFIACYTVGADGSLAPRGHAAVGRTDHRRDRPPVHEPAGTIRVEPVV